MLLPNPSPNESNNMPSLPQPDDKVIVFPRSAAPQQGREWDRLTAAFLMKQNAEGGIHPRILEALLIAAKVAP
jgi:hypothetical protein